MTDESVAPASLPAGAAVKAQRIGVGVSLALWGGFLCLATAYLIWGWSHDISDFGGDSSVYMLAARYFSPFWPSSPVFAEFAKAMAYPPLFPFLIGLLGGSMLAGHLLVIASLLASILSLYAWLRLEGLTAITSGCACLVFALMPGTYLLALNIWSETLYLFLSLLAIALGNRAEAEEGKRLSLWWMAAAAAASSSLVRAAALPLLAAFAIRLLIVRPRGWYFMILASALPFAVWNIWSRFYHPTGIGYVSQWIGSYAHDAIGALVAQVCTESSLVLRAWTQAWLGETTVSSLHYVCLAAGVLGVFGWLQRMASLRFDAIYAGLYGVLLLVWPFPAEARRLSYILIPVLLAYGLLLHAPGPRRFRFPDKLPPALWLGALAIVVLPSLILTIRRFNEPPPADLAMARHIEAWYRDDRQQAIDSSRSFIKILIDLPHVRDLVPEGACIFSIKPSVVSLYSGYPSYVPPSISTADDEFEHGIDRCKYAYLLAYTSPSFHEAFYPLARLKERTVSLSVSEDGEGENTRAYAALIEIRARP
ncbi:MAG: hypothetical protein JWR07_4821 [Nevskia sp.]|nr:hypothetical protein [Nevskia sp.]